MHFQAIYIKKEFDVDTEDDSDRSPSVSLIQDDRIKHEFCHPEIDIPADELSEPLSNEDIEGYMSDPAPVDHMGMEEGCFNIKIDPDDEPKKLNATGKTKKFNLISSRAKRGNRSRYECVYCKVSYKTMATLKRHLGPDFVFGPLNCSYCTHTFQTYKCCLNHMDKEHLAHRPVVCDVCSKSFHATISFEKHQKKEHSIFECNLCRERLPSANQLKTHRKLHRPLLQRTDLRTCTHCGKVLSSVASLQEHIMLVHEVGHVTCELCNKEFLNKQRLYRHKIRYHQPSQFICPFCGIISARKHFIDHHIATRHNPSDPFACSLCSYRHATAIGLERHQKYKCSRRLPMSQQPVASRKARPHRDPKLSEMHNRILKDNPYATYECVYCHMQTTSIFHLFKHVRDKALDRHAKRMRCLVCDKRLPSISCFRSHTRTVHESPDCPLCHVHVDDQPGKYYKHIERRHLQVQCAICDAVTNGLTSWLRHIDMHDDRRRFPCESCSQSFDTQPKMVRHAIKHHNGIDCPKCGTYIGSDNQLDHSGQLCRNVKPAARQPEPLAKSDASAISDSSGSSNESPLCRFVQLLYAESTLSVEPPKQSSIDLN